MDSFFVATCCLMVSLSMIFGGIHHIGEPPSLGTTIGKMFGFIGLLMFISLFFFLLIYMGEPIKLNTSNAELFDELDKERTDKSSSVGTNEFPISSITDVESVIKNELLYIPAEKNNLSSNIYSQDQTDARRNVVIHRLTLGRGMTNINNSFLFLLEKVSPIDAVLLSHFSFMKSTLTEEELLVEFYREYGYREYRRILFSLEPSIIEALHIWENSSVGRILNTEEVLLFLNTNEFDSLFRYSLSLTRDQIMAVTSGLR